jgi:prepilin-type N-terminal cleavage/methylation domain-containing protein
VRRNGPVNDAPQTAAATPSDTGARHGFTLVELLAVILIIGMLAGLLTPAVMQALKKSRNAAIKAEIDMLHMAIMNYKNEYGSFPPAASALVPGSPVFRHMQRLFPRCSNIPGQFVGPNAGPVTPENALVSWLRGYTNDPTSPLQPPGNRKWLFDFDRARISATASYAPAGKPGAPYIYIDASNYQAFPYTHTGPGAMFVPPPPPPPPVADNRPVDKHRWFTNLGLSGIQEQEFFNPDSFQIICAGRDEEFGTDDDLSNFWPGTRREYLDSLK